VTAVPVVRAPLRPRAGAVANLRRNGIALGCAALGTAAGCVLLDAGWVSVVLVAASCATIGTLVAEAGELAGLVSCAGQGRGQG
jgi:hypothetical protein